MNFLEFLKQHTPLSEKCETALYLATTPLIMEANSTLLSPNQISDKIYFVEKGLLRTYYYADAEADFTITSWFTQEGGLLTTIHSFLAKSPADEYTKTLEDCTLRVLEFKTLEQLYIEYPELYITAGKLYEYYLQIYGKGNSYLLSSKTEPNVPVIVVRNFEAFNTTAEPQKNKNARISGLQEKITYIKCPDLGAIESWLKGKPELRFEGVVYNDAFSAAFLAFTKDQHPTRSDASGGYYLTQGLFYWNFAGNHGPDYYIQAMELDDTGATYKITVTVGKKDSGSASFELSYKDNDEKLAGELINYTTSTPHTVSDSNIEYVINQ